MTSNIVCAVCLALVDKVFFKEVPDLIIDKGFKWEYLRQINNSFIQYKDDLVSVCSTCANKMENSKEDSFTKI